MTACERNRCEPIEDGAGECDDDCEAEGGDGAGKLFVARGIESIGDEPGGADSEKAGDKQITGAEGAGEIGLADAEHDEGDKLEQKA